MGQPLRPPQRQSHKRPPPPLLSQAPPWLGSRDLRWQQQQVRELLLQERQKLLYDSQLMGPDSLLAAYSYEHAAYVAKSQGVQRKVDASGTADDTRASASAAEVSEDSTQSSKLPPQALSEFPTPSTGGSVSFSHGVTFAAPEASKATYRLLGSTAACSHQGQDSMPLGIAQHRARLFARSERLTPMVRMNTSGPQRRPHE